MDNQTGNPLTIQNITVFWNKNGYNSDKGSNKLSLTSAALGSVFWSGNINASSYTITPSNLSVPAGLSTIVFTFDNTYGIPNGSEQILINLSGSTCTTIDSK